MKFAVKPSVFVTRSLHDMSLHVVQWFALPGLPAFPGLFVPVVLMVLVGLSVQACVREQMADCMQYELRVSAVDSQGVDVTSSGAVTSINLYLFGENGFIRSVPEGSFDSFLFSAEKDRVLTLIAWGNLKGDSLDIPDLQVGTSLKDAKIKLLQTVAGYELPVTDLFYSRREIGSTTTRGMQNDTLQLVMKRLSAALSVCVSHGAEYFGNAAFHPHIVVRGTGTSLNFLAEPSDDVSDYAPVMHQVGGEDVWTTPLFRVLPTGQEQRISIDLYRDDTLALSITTDDEGNALRALPGKETYITVDFSYARLCVSVSVRPWGSTNQQVEL